MTEDREAQEGLDTFIMNCLREYGWAVEVAADGGILVEGLSGSLDDHKAISAANRKCAEKSDR